MLLPLALLGLGSGLLAWGLHRQKKASTSALALPPAAVSFPWESATPAPVSPSKTTSILDNPAASLADKYDEGLSSDELAAIVYARAKEASPSNLDAFADALAPDYPISVTRLRVQAKQLRRNPYLQAASAKVEQASQKLSTTLASRLSPSLAGSLLEKDKPEREWSTFFTLPGVMPPPSLASVKREMDQELDRKWKSGQITTDEWNKTRDEWGRHPEVYDKLAQERLAKKQDEWVSIHKPVYDVYMNTRVPVSRYSWGLGGPDPKKQLPVFEMPLADALREAYYDKEAEKNRALQRATLLERAVKLAKVGENIVVEYYSFGLKIVTPIVANIPVLGTAAAFVSTAAIDLAKGQELDDALLDATGSSLPGQPFSKAAFNAAVQAIRALARGERLDKMAVGVALDAGWEALPSEVKSVPGARAAFDGGVALTQGKELQDAGFVALRRLANGNGFLEQGVDFSEKLVHGEKIGVSLKDVLVSSLVAKASAVSNFGEKVTPLVDEMTKNVKLAEMSPAELAKEKNVPEPVAHAALASLRPLPIPEWLSQRLGLGDIYYPDPEFVAMLNRRRKIVALPSAKVAKGADVIGKVMERKKWVSHYLQQIRVDQQPYLSSKLPLGVKIFG